MYAEFLRLLPVRAGCSINLHMSQNIYDRATGTCMCCVLNCGDNNSSETVVKAIVNSPETTSGDELPSDDESSLCTTSEPASTASSSSLSSSTIASATGMSVDSHYVKE